MKSLKNYFESLLENPIYVDDFSKREDVFQQFVRDEDPDIRFAFAAYVPGDYSGDAAIFYYRESTGKWYEAYGSHCSCMGLEYQWDKDEEIVFEELEKRLDRVQDYYQDSLTALKRAFDEAQ